MAGDFFVVNGISEAHGSQTTPPDGPVPAVMSNNGEEANTNSIWSDLIGSVDYENQAEDPNHRPYDRFLLMPTPLTLSGGGKAAFLAWQQDEIQALDSGNVWVLLHTVTSMGTSFNTGLHSGLYAVWTRDGGFYACGLYAGLGAGEMGWVKFDQTTWTSAIVSGFFGISNLQNGVAFKSRLYVAGDDFVYSFDPILEVIEEIPVDSSVNSRLIVWEGRLLLITEQSGQMKILEHIAGGFTEVLDLGATDGIGGQRIMTWVDFNPALYVGFASNDGGERGLRIERVIITAGIFSSSDVSDPVVGDYVSSGGEFLRFRDSGPNVSGYFFDAAMSDLNANPSVPVLPTMRWWTRDAFRSNAFTHQFNGFQAESIFIGRSVTKGLDGTLDFPSSCWGTGDRSFPGGFQDRAMPTSIIQEGTKFKIAFKAHGPIRGAVHVKLIFEDAAGMPRFEGKLTGPVTGGVASLDSGNNRLQLVDIAPGGGVEHTFFWDYTDDGVPVGAEPVFTLDIF